MNTTVAFLYGIFGAGGFGRECISLAHEWCQTMHASTTEFELCFIEHRPQRTMIDGYRVLTLREFADVKGVERRFNPCVADTDDRKNIAEQCETLGLQPFTIRSRLAEVHPTAVIGEGAVLCQFTLVSANARVGRYLHLNHHSY